MAVVRKDEADVGIATTTSIVGTSDKKLNGPNVAAATPKLYRDGVGCSACYQIRCLDPDLCSKTWQKIVVTDITTNNQTDFMVPKHTFATLALPHKGAALRRKGIVDIEYERIVCVYEGHNLTVKVDESSRYPNYLAVEFLYQGGQTDIVNIDVAQVGHFEWKYLTRKDGSAVWSISNPPSGDLQFRFVVTSGFDGYMLWSEKDVLPPHWKAAEKRLFDTRLQINQIALDVSGWHAGTTVIVTIGGVVVPSTTPVVTVIAVAAGGMEGPAVSPQPCGPAHVDESNRYPDYLAVEFLYQGGQTYIVNARNFEWKYLTRDHGATVWSISNPLSRGLQFRFVISSGYGSSAHSKSDSPHIPAMGVARKLRTAASRDDVTCPELAVKDLWWGH
ncbi:expansin-like A1 [Cryptomeria japonica]|uniref:expansin-like A1 n=1 Tax=Cryptomeria japonica TaxID=3369 RepID=UPI0027DA73CA|nr:expansin-like A1 [Cryptomeria japonica]